MRKVDPQGVRDDFVDAVQGVQVLSVLVQDAPGAPRVVAELQLLSAAVLWEGFLTDLFVAYVNGDSKKFTQDLKDRITASVKAKFGETAAARTEIKLGKHLDRETVAGLLDPDGRNVAFGSAADVVESAQRRLPKEAADRFKALTPAERAAIDGWTAIRHFVAHRSQAAEDKMNEALAVPAIQPELRRGKNRVNSAGKYLAARIGRDTTRADVIFRLMSDLAARM